jgi:hypothetical protein
VKNVVCAEGTALGLTKENHAMKIGLTMLLLLVVAAIPALASAQELADSGDSSSAVAITTPAQI